MPKVFIAVEEGNALAIPADVLAVKHAQAMYGVDGAVVACFERAGRSLDLPRPSEVRLEASPEGVAASQVLFVGVPPLREFGYRGIRAFARQVLSALASDAPGTRHLAMTVHGPGYGLDEGESFEAEVAGLVDAAQVGDIPKALERVTVVERDSGRAKRLQLLLASLLPGSLLIEDDGRRTVSGGTAERLRAAGYASESKAHVFVAMPFKEEMDDVFHYGIQRAVKGAGFLCERADLSSFAGDVLEWVRGRIRSASLVVADLTDANPNVYLEVGYAWGVGVRTVLIVRDAEHLKFDVRGQRCLVYRKIKQLEELLRAELENLRGDV